MRGSPENRPRRRPRPRTKTEYDDESKDQRDCSPRGPFSSLGVPLRGMRGSATVRRQKLVHVPRAAKDGTFRGIGSSTRTSNTNGQPRSQKPTLGSNHRQLSSSPHPRLYLWHPSLSSEYPSISGIP